MGRDKIAILVCLGSPSVPIPAQVSLPFAAFADHSPGQWIIPSAATGAEDFQDACHNPVFPLAGTCKHSRTHSLSKCAVEPHLSCLLLSGLSAILIFPQQNYFV